MKKTVRALYSVGCIAAILAAVAIGTASAAVVPFDGTEYSWLHVNANGQPEGSWITQINDMVTVRAGDSMQFRNRWHNSYAGTADIRISYGGGQSYTCIGADEYVFYGLNYGNYYPSGTESVSFYSKVVAGQGDPDSLEEYNLVVNHQYVCNGVLIGCAAVGDKWRMRFQCTNQSGQYSDLGEAPVQPEDTPATATPDSASRPEDTPIAGDLPTPTPTPIPIPIPTPLPVSGSPAIQGCAIFIAYAIVCITKKKE